MGLELEEARPDVFEDLGSGSFSEFVWFVLVFAKMVDA